MSFKVRIKTVFHNVCMFLLNIIQSIVYNIAQLFRPQLKKIFEIVFDSIGITINGKEDYDIQVNDEKAFALILAYGFNGCFECFVEKKLEVKNEEKMCEKVFEWKYFWLFPTLDIWSQIEGFINKTFDVQTVINSWKDGGDHYDHFSESIQLLGGPMSLYSCCDFDNTSDLTQAEIDQLKKVASKLHLKPGMKVLDIGCGFGGLAEYLAKNYDVFVTGVTISDKMASAAKKRCAKLNVEILQCDYREIPASKYDRITCIEMIEHIGEHHHNDFFRLVHEHLKEDGIFILQHVANNQPFMYEYYPFFIKYLKMRITFPRVQKTIHKACEYFVLEHLENQGFNFGITCSTGYRRIIEMKSELIQTYGERVYRIGCLYIAIGSAILRTRLTHNVLIVFSKNGLKYSYTSQ